MKESLKMLRSNHSDFDFETSYQSYRAVEVTLEE